MIVNMKVIYTPYHWFFSVEMLNRNSTSRTGTKYHEIQLRLPKCKFIMIPIFEPLILNSHCTKQIVRKNVWKLNLKTITMTIMFHHSYILDVQILSSNKLKISSPIWVIADVWVVFINSVHYIISIELCTSLLMISKISLEYPIDSRNGNKKVGLIRAYFIDSFYNVVKDEKIHLKNGSPLLVKRGCYTTKEIEKVSSGKVKYDSLTGKSVIDPTISRF